MTANRLLLAAIAALAFEGRRPPAGVGLGALNSCSRLSAAICPVVAPTRPAPFLYQRFNVLCDRSQIRI
jgi:hypothetical protein